MNHLTKSRTIADSVDLLESGIGTENWPGAIDLGAEIFQYISRYVMHVLKIIIFPCWKSNELNDSPESLDLRLYVLKGALK